MADVNSDKSILQLGNSNTLPSKHPSMITPISRRSKKMKKRFVQLNSSPKSAPNGRYFDQNGVLHTITFVISEKEATCLLPTPKFSEIVRALADTYKRRCKQSQNELSSANSQETLKASVSKEFSPMTNDPRSFVVGDSGETRNNVFLSSVDEM